LSKLPKKNTWIFESQNPTLGGITMKVKMKKERKRRKKERKKEDDGLMMLYD
jgi:hypothetical protein